MKPGYKTTEFWIALVSQGLALLMIAGLITPADKTTLESALANAVTAVATIISSVWVVLRYIESRHALKADYQGATARPTTPTALPFALLAVLLIPAFASAQPPAHTTIGYWKGRYDERQQQRQQQPQQPQTDPALLQTLNQLAQNQQQILALLAQRQAPQQPQIIILPYQQIPLGGPPAQQIPLGGPPQQQIPLGGPPQQQIPIGGPPQQQIPIGQPPLQQIPLGGPAPQQITPQTPGPNQPAPVPKQVIPIGPPAPTYQRYSQR
jgi:hypothetical protein